jgi:putative two-component system response regulator
MTNTSEMFRKSRILIVDDNPANVRLLEAMLEIAGDEDVQGVTDPRLVLSLHREARFDLILLDIRMPHLDGIQVMEQLAGAIKDDYLPVLVLTAEKDKNTMMRALEQGAKDFVTKPFDREEILNRIENMLEVRSLYNERLRQNEILEEKVQERTRELADTRLEIIRRLGRASEFRDNETGMHVIRMSKSSQRLALAWGLGAAEAEMILQASPMHDLGKIGIPDHILLKPGKLSGDEWNIMKTHVMIGVDILDGHDAELMRMARSIALTHHEKWDGSGYPNGLKGADIPLEGRISAIADVFDALTSERPYKKAWSIEEAVAYIQANAGIQFDPDLLDKFNEALPDILRIREDYSDDN